MSWLSPDHAPRHRPRLPGLPLPGRLARGGLRAAAGLGAHPHADLRARRLGVLHGVDVLRQRGARRQPRPRVPDDLPRARLCRAAVAGPPAQAGAGVQGAAHHVDLRLHLEPLRQVGGARHARRGPGGVRHDPVHRAPAQGRLGVVQDDPPRGLGAGRLRPDPARGRDPRPVRDPLRRAEPRLHQAADRAHDRRGGGVRGQAPRLPRSSASTSRGVSSGASAISSGGSPRHPELVASARPRPGRRPPPTRGGRRCS